MDMHLNNYMVNPQRYQEEELYKEAGGNTAVLQIPNRHNRSDTFIRLLLLCQEGVNRSTSSFLCPTVQSCVKQLIHKKLKKHLKVATLL